MMKKILLSVLMGAALLGCGQDKSVTSNLPTAQLLSAESIGHYCMMDLSEHTGPKAQLYTKSRLDKPYWFSTVKQVFMFKELPEEPKDIVAIYVTDMAKVKDWSTPNADSDWIDAKEAYYVIKSSFIGGMGAEDALPFSDKSKAESFIAQHGGELVRFEDMPSSYIMAASVPSPHAHPQHGAGHEKHHSEHNQTSPHSSHSSH